MIGDFHIIIPARMSSSRLPGKPLKRIGSCTLIEHVLNNARATRALSITVATDDERIAAVVGKAGGTAVMTRSDHLSGSDRIAEAARQLKLPPQATILNIQGDEPEIPIDLAHQVVDALHDNQQSVMATACTKIDDAEQINDPSIVKVVRDKYDYALYFSRSVIPYIRTDYNNDQLPSGYQRHLGIYAYSNQFIQNFTASPPAPIEQYEQLEQLRVLWQGDKIVCPEACQAPAPGIDTEADLARIRKKHPA